MTFIKTCNNFLSADMTFNSERPTIQWQQPVFSAPSFGTSLQSEEFLNLAEDHLIGHIEINSVTKSTVEEEEDVTGEEKVDGVIREQSGTTRWTTGLPSAAQSHANTTSLPNQPERSLPETNVSCNEKDMKSVNKAEGIDLNI